MNIFLKVGWFGPKSNAKCVIYIYIIKFFITVIHVHTDKVYNKRALKELLFKFTRQKQKAEFWIRFP